MLELPPANESLELCESIKDPHLPAHSLHLVCFNGLTDFRSTTWCRVKALECSRLTFAQRGVSQLNSVARCNVMTSPPLRSEVNQLDDEMSTFAGALLQGGSPELSNR